MPTPVAPSVRLPDLRQHPSPNTSTRHGITPYLIVVHRPVGSFESAELTLTREVTPQFAGVSAHVLLGTGHRAVQLVPWSLKAWACETFNAASYNLEVGDEAWTGHAPELWNDAARAVAFLCARTGIPPAWSTNPLHSPGIVRHYDLGRAGGGHSDPTTDHALFGRFVQRVKFEHDHGGFRPTWGVGTLERLGL